MERLGHMFAIVAAVMAPGCGRAAPAPPTQELLAAVLAHIEMNPVADQGLLSSPALLFDEVGGWDGSLAATVAARGGRWRLISRPELQPAADAAGNTIYLLHLSVTVSGTTAMVEVTISEQQPSSARPWFGGTCCCSTTQRWDGSRGGWMLVSSRLSWCA